MLYFSGVLVMKRLAIALILVAAAPAVVSASSNLMSEMTGKNELVAESVPSAESTSLAAKSSRPQIHHSDNFDQPAERRLTVGWL